jgi:hypothetical protein
MVSVGNDCVWAVSQKEDLYFRENVSIIIWVFKFKAVNLKMFSLAICMGINCSYSRT